MSDSDASLYDEVIEGLRCNRELEIYYNDSTYGIVTYGPLWQLSALCLISNMLSVSVKLSHKIDNFIHFSLILYSPV